MNRDEEYFKFIMDLYNPFPKSIKEDEEDIEEN